MVFHSHVILWNENQPRLLENGIVLNLLIVAMQQEIFISFVANRFRVQPDNL